MTNRSVNFDPGSLAALADELADKLSDILERLSALEASNQFADHQDLNKRLSKLERFEGSLEKAFAGEVGPVPDLAAIEAATVAATAEKKITESGSDGAVDPATPTASQDRKDG